MKNGLQGDFWKTMVFMTAQSHPKQDHHDNHDQTYDDLPALVPRVVGITSCPSNPVSDAVPPLISKSADFQDNVFDYALAIAPVKAPFFYDPSDATIDHGVGRVVSFSLGENTSKDELRDVPGNWIDHDTINNLLINMSYREITGYEDYDGYYDGYPVCYHSHPTEDQEEPHVPTLGVHQTSAVHMVDTEPGPFDSRGFATRSWHRVLHENLHPSKLQPYLGFAPLRVISKTLSRTTQMAKMVIRYPLRRHVRSRMSFMRAQRLNETVSTDPMYANCRCLGHGYTGIQVFYG